MKVRIKNTRVIMNADPNATVMLEYLDDTYCNIELPLDEIELIPENDVPYSEIERRKRITEEHLESTIFLAMKKGYELGMEDAKEALKQQTTNANKTN